MPLVTRLTPKSLNTQQPNRCYDLHIYTTSNYQHRLYEPSNDTNQSINHDYYLFCVFSVYAIVGGCRRRWSLRCGKVDRTIPIYVLVHRAIILQQHFTPSFFTLSLITIRETRGPTFEPWGTPDFTYSSFPTNITQIRKLMWTEHLFQVKFLLKKSIPIT